MEAPVDFLMQKAVFVTDHQPCFGVILGNQQAQSASLLGTIEDEIGDVGLSGSERLGERSGTIPEARKSRLAFS